MQLARVIVIPTSSLQSQPNSIMSSRSLSARGHSNCLQSNTKTLTVTNPRQVTRGQSLLVFYFLSAKVSCVADSSLDNLCSVLSTLWDVTGSKLYQYSLLFTALHEAIGLCHLKWCGLYVCHAMLSTLLYDGPNPTQSWTFFFFLPPKTAEGSNASMLWYQFQMG